METQRVDSARSVSSAAATESRTSKTSPKASHGGNAAFKGLWRSEGDSIYLGTGREFICLMPHSTEFQGWIGKVAVKEIHREGDGWAALQAFRDRSTGDNPRWVPIKLAIKGDKVTKSFPTSEPFDACIYGYVQFYFRIQDE